MRISKYKNIFAQGYTPNWSEEAFAVKKIQNMLLLILIGHMLLLILMVKKLLEHFMKKNCKRLINKNLE